MLKYTETDCLKTAVYGITGKYDIQKALILDKYPC